MKTKLCKFLLGTLIVAISMQSSADDFDGAWFIDANMTTNAEHKYFLIAPSRTNGEKIVVFVDRRPGNPPTETRGICVDAKFTNPIFHKDNKLECGLDDNDGTAGKTPFTAALLGSQFCKGLKGGSSGKVLGQGMGICESKKCLCYTVGPRKTRPEQPGTGTGTAP